MSTLNYQPACEVRITRGHASTAFLSSQVFRPQYPVPGTIGPEVRHGAQPLVPTSLFISLAAKWRVQSQALSSLHVCQRSSSNVVSLLPAQSPTPVLSLGRLQRKSRNPDPRKRRRKWPSELFPPLHCSLILKPCLFWAPTLSAFSSFPQQTEVDAHTQVHTHAHA